jgi:hypothetical protein
MQCNIYIFYLFILAQTVITKNITYTILHTKRQNSAESYKIVSNNALRGHGRPPVVVTE